MLAKFLVFLSILCAFHHLLKKIGVLLYSDEIDRYPLWQPEDASLYEEPFCPQAFPKPLLFEPTYFPTQRSVSRSYNPWTQEHTITKKPQPLFKVDKGDPSTTTCRFPSFVHPTMWSPFPSQPMPAKYAPYEVAQVQCTNLSSQTINTPLSTTNTQEISNHGVGAQYRPTMVICSHLEYESNFMLFDMVDLHIHCGQWMI